MPDVAVGSGRIDLERFSLELITALGGVVDRSGYARLDAMLPSEIAERAGLPEFVTLAFDREAARETPGAELVTFGSSALDKLVSLGVEVGRVVRRFALVSSVRVPANLMERIENTITFVRSRRPELRMTSIQAYESALFCFIVFYISDEKFSETVSIAVDSVTLGDDTPLLPELDAAFFSEDPGVLSGVQVAKGHSYREMLDTAAMLLGGYVKPGLTASQARVGRFCRDELVKMLRYYDRTLADLEGRLKAHADDPDRKARIEAKIESAKAERERRILDIIDKYRITVKARLDSVTLSVFPKVKALLDIQHKDRTYSVEVFYNLATNSVEPLVCPRCKGRFTVAYPAEDGKFVCRPEEA